MSFAFLRPMLIDDAALGSSTVPESDYTAWAGATTYAIGDRVRRVTTDTHKVFEAVQAMSSPGNDPLLDDVGAYWLEVSATNRWKALDDITESRTEQADSVSWVFNAVGRIDAVAVLNVSAASVRVQVEDAVDGLVYDQTVSLISTGGITDFYAWFYNPIQRQRDVVFLDLPPGYLDPTITITVEDPGETVGVGVLKIGQLQTLGATQWGAQVGIRDASRKGTDDFGGSIVVQRAYRKRASFALNVAPSFVDELVNQLAEFRTTPLVFIGDAAYGATIAFGIWIDFTVVIAGPTLSNCSLEIEGLS